MTSSQQSTKWFCNVIGCSREATYMPPDRTGPTLCVLHQPGKATLVVTADRYYENMPRLFLRRVGLAAGGGNWAWVEDQDEAFHFTSCSSAAEVAGRQASSPQFRVRVARRDETGLHFLSEVDTAKEPMKLCFWVSCHEPALQGKTYCMKHRTTYEGTTRAEAEERERSGPSLELLAVKIEEALALARELRLPDRSDRNRRLSMTIAALEHADLWLGSVKS